MFWGTRAGVCGGRAAPNAPTRAAQIADEAERIVYGIADSNKRSAALVALVVAFADTHQSGRAARVASTIEHPDERATAYRFLCDALVRQRMWAEAEQVASVIADHEDTSDVYQQILGGIVRETASDDQPAKRSELVSLARKLFARSLARTNSFAAATVVAEVLPDEVREFCETLIPELTD